MYTLETLELVAAIRQVLTVAKSLQERTPDATPHDIAEGVDGAITLKLAKLKVKGYSKLTPAQQEAYKALSDAQQVMPDVQAILEKARERTAEEIADSMAANETAKAKRKVAAEKRKAKKEAEETADTQTQDMFAEA